MKEWTLTNRYAKALVQLAKEDGAISDVREGLRRFLELVRERGDFFIWLANDEVTQAKRCALLNDIAKELALNSTLVKFIELLIARERVRFIAQIARSFNEQADSAEGILRGNLIAVTVSAGEKVRANIEAVFGKKFGKKVMLTVKEDKTILGGLVLLMKDYVWDASVKRTLNEIRNVLVQ